MLPTPLLAFARKKGSGSNVTNAVNNLTHILVVDDEKELADVLELYLTNVSLHPVWL